MKYSSNTHDALRLNELGIQVTYDRTDYATARRSLSINTNAAETHPLTLNYYPKFSRRLILFSFSYLKNRLREQIHSAGTERRVTVHRQ